MRIGVFGGTFDPIHQGHLILAEQAREQGRLDQVWFLPAPRPPHKDETALTRYEQRVEMIQLAVAGQPAFRVDEREKDRPGPSYTVDTLAELQRARPGDDFFLLLGSDSLRDLPQWRDPGRLVRMAGLLVLQRPGHPLRKAGMLRKDLDLNEGDPMRIEVIDAPLIDISSRDLRRRAAGCRSLRYFLPRAVEMYILEKHLYRDSGGEKDSHAPW